jgi:putative cell wall-binding protein
MAEIKALNPTNIILLGSTPSISASQETAFKKAGYSVTRYGGANRYETAQIIGNAVEALGGSKTAVLVTGVNYPDALSMGTIAGMNKMPIIFSTATGLPTETSSFISANSITAVISVGYTAMNAPIVSATQSAVGAANITYITGADRYATSLAIATKYKSGFANGVTVATGANFPDALTGAVLAAKMKYPVLLVNPATGASAGATSYVKGLGSSGIVYVYGSAATLSDTTVQGLYK